MTLSDLPTPRAYWCTVNDFHVFVGVKKRLPSRNELIAARALIKPMRSLIDAGLDPNTAISSSVMRYLLYDLASPLPLWPALQPRSSIATRRLEAKHALLRAERKLNILIRTLDRGPRP